jgi:hypothetical protein
MWKQLACLDCATLLPVRWLFDRRKGGRFCCWLQGWLQSRLGLVCIEQKNNAISRRQKGLVRKWPNCCCLGRRRCCAAAFSIQLSASCAGKREKERMWALIELLVMLSLLVTYSLHQRKLCSLSLSPWCFLLQRKISGRCYLKEGEESNAIWFQSVHRFDIEIIA